MENKILYRLENLKYSYGGAVSPSLDLKSLELLEGECVLVTGPNGSGKTTFLKVLNNLIAPESVLSGWMEFRGEMVINGSAVGGVQSLRQASVYLHQHPYILAGSVGRNMDFACKARNIPAREAVARSRAALDLVGLGDLPRERYRGLSGGESQRLALARAIATGAQVLLLDEPTSSADSDSCILIVKALQTLVSGGTTVIFASHDTELLEPLAQRVLEFKNGAIVCDSHRREKR